MKNKDGSLETINCKITYLLNGKEDIETWKRQNMAIISYTITIEYVKRLFWFFPESVLDSFVALKNLMVLIKQVSLSLLFNVESTYSLLSRLFFFLSFHFYFRYIPKYEVTYLLYIIFLLATWPCNKKLVWKKNNYHKLF